MPGPGSPIVVDTNILFSALLRGDSPFALTLAFSGRPFFIGETVLVELFRHKERIQRHSRLAEDELLILLHQLLRGIQVYKEEFIPPRLHRAALDLCRGIDPADAPIVALTLTLDAWLWTGDRALRAGLEQRGFTSFFDPSQPSE